MIVRYARAFGAFWYDFLVGDRLELFVGPLAALVVVWLLIQAHVNPAIAGIVLLAEVLLIIAASLYLATRRRT